jgi:hypothetical protein
MYTHRTPPSRLTTSGHKHVKDSGQAHLRSALVGKRTRPKGMASPNEDLKGRTGTNQFHSMLYLDL